MIASWLKRRRLFFVMASLLMVTSGLLLYWLYLGSIEREKLRLMDLALLHVQQLETLSKIPERSAHESGKPMAKADRIKTIFDSQPKYHRFGETGKIILIGGTDIPFGLNGSGQRATELLADGEGGKFLMVYAPLVGVPIGVAATIDLQEIQLPYLQSGIGILELLAMLLGGMFIFYRKDSGPQNIQDNEATIRAIVASAGEGIVTFNEYAEIETFNETAESMFLYQMNEIIGKPFLTLLVSSDQNTCDTFLLTYRSQGTTRMSGVVKEFQGQRKDGTVFPLTLTLTEAPIWGHRLFTVLLRDITEQKMAERRLAAQYAVAQVLAECTTIQEATPEILRAVCESLGWQLGILWQVDPDLQVLRCVEVWRASPDRFSRFVALTQSMTFSKGVGLPGRTWSGGQPVWIPDAVQDKNFPRAPMAAEEGLHAAFAFPIQLGPAIHGVMEFFSREIQEPDQALLHQMLSVGSQIGQFMQRKITEMTLREREEETRLILDAALDAVVTFNETEHILSWNSQAERMFGWSRQEILGQSLVRTIIPPSYREGYLEGLQSYVQTGVSEILNHRVELSGLHRDGHDFPLEMAMTAVRSKGQFIFSGFFRDLTERRQTEEALRKSGEQLRQAQKMEAIGTLAGGIAHDFNNILASIIGYTELAMAQSGVNSGVVPRLQEVLQAGYRAKKLVRQILTFSRQDESGKKVLFLQPIVEEALNLLRASLPSTISLEADLQSNTSPVLADATQIHQVIMNLGANAEYAMRESGGKLIVKLDQIDVAKGHPLLRQGISGGAYIRLTVSDSGKGIAPNIQKRIFDPFFTTKDVGEGTGLGLSVIHGVVTSHGGIIQVESREGGSTTFFIYLPCSTSVPSAGPSISVMPASSFGQGRVMFVDDEISIVRWGKDMLEALGYEVKVFTNAADALEVFKQNPDHFDVLVTDQTMPGMTGERLAQQVMSYRPKFPVILCSGFSYSMNEQKAGTMGLQAYLTKPVLMGDMARAIQAAMQHKILHSTA
jgi:PAS domain S-box-containing protein